MLHRTKAKEAKDFKAIAHEVGLSSDKPEPFIKYIRDAMCIAKIRLYPTILKRKPDWYDSRL